MFGIAYRCFCCVWHRCETDVNSVLRDIRNGVARKASKLGANAVLGYRQFFDIEETGYIVTRSYGTACIIRKVSFAWIEWWLAGYDSTLVGYWTSMGHPFEAEQIYRFSRMASPQVSAAAFPRLRSPQIEDNSIPNLSTLEERHEAHSSPITPSIVPSVLPSPSVLPGTLIRAASSDANPLGIFLP